MLTRNDFLVLLKNFVVDEFKRFVIMDYYKINKKFFSIFNNSILFKFVYLNSQTLKLFKDVHKELFNDFVADVFFNFYSVKDFRFLDKLFKHDFFFFKNFFTKVSNEIFIKKVQEAASSLFLNNFSFVSPSIKSSGFYCTGDFSIELQRMFTLLNHNNFMFLNKLFIKEDFFLVSRSYSIFKSFSKIFAQYFIFFNSSSPEKASFEKIYYYFSKNFSRHNFLLLQDSSGNIIVHCFGLSNFFNSSALANTKFFLGNQDTSLQINN